MSNNFFLTFANSFTLFMRKQQIRCLEEEKKNEVEAEKYLRTVPFSMVVLHAVLMKKNGSMKTNHVVR